MEERQRRYDVCTFCRRVQAWREQIKYFSQFRLAPNICKLGRDFFCVLAHVSSTYFCKDAGIHFFLSIIAYFVMRCVFSFFAGECKLYEVLVRDFVFVYWCPARPTNKQLAQRLLPHFYFERSRFNLRSSLDYSPFFRPFQSFRPFPKRASIEYQEKKTTEVKWELLRKWKMHRKQQQRRTVDDENISKTFCAWKVKEKLQREFFIKNISTCEYNIKTSSIRFVQIFFLQNSFFLASSSIRWALQ